jgi:hypothetical protein
MEKEIVGCIAIMMFVCITLSGCDTKGADTDKDGIVDKSDAFPNDPAASRDSDSDGYPNEWNDAWNETDGETNLTLDAFPRDPKEWIDSDGDGYGDNSDEFPDDPEIHLVKYIFESRTDVLGVQGEVHYNIEISGDDKYLVIYWTIDSGDDQAGDALTIKYKSPNGWSTGRHGLSGELKRNVTSAGGSGTWQVFIANQGHLIGYDSPFTITYRIYTLE